MNNKFQMPKVFETLFPFLIAGIAIALIIGLLFMFSYVVIWGIMIGGVLWLLSMIKELFFPVAKKDISSAKKKPGRIIEHDDKK